jgi:hypothetical protein
MTERIGEKVAQDTLQQVGIRPQAHSFHTVKPDREFSVHGQR